MALLEVRNLSKNFGGLAAVSDFDLDVDEGKARWLEPGEKSGWGSPSFVVDQDGKGLLGRPVRDYRYVNSQTLDVAWPSANAERVLQRAQQAALHSTLDCIWGFTQVPIGIQMAHCRRNQMGIAAGRHRSECGRAR